jgi:abortive infection bacteriophage resistance protein
VKYTKPPLDLDAQVALLHSRGMSGDHALMKRRLASVNYYRLSGYWFPFRQPDDSFRSGTSFETVWDRYVFDRRLRLLVMDALERIEVAIRTKLSYHHSLDYSAFAYATDPHSLPKLRPHELSKFLDKLRDEKRQGMKEKFVEHFDRKYGDVHAHLPIWMASEVMTFGCVLTMFRGAANQTKQAVASAFGVPHEVLSSWLLCLNTIRNICAHHSRLWNRELGVKPMIPRAERYPDWHRPVVVDNRRVFSVLTICNYCLQKIAAGSKWALRLLTLLREFPQVPLANMGLPGEWLECPIWGNAR